MPTFGSVFLQFLQAEAQYHHHSVLCHFLTLLASQRSSALFPHRGTNLCSVQPGQITWNEIFSEGCSFLAALKHAETFLSRNKATFCL